jgi:hypothetical protein
MSFAPSGVQVCSKVFKPLPGKVPESLTLDRCGPLGLCRVNALGQTAAGILARGAGIG